MYDCERMVLDGSWTPGKSKLRTSNAMLDQEGPAQTSWCFEWAAHAGKLSSMCRSLSDVPVALRVDCMFCGSRVYGIVWWQPGGLIFCLGRAVWA
jgi:hypothetical protein